MANGECRSANKENQPYTYEWKFEYCDGQYNAFERKISPFFHFCGYYCQLYFDVVYVDGFYSATIRLNGYPAPYKKNVSCYYSANLVNIKGKVIFAKEGRMHLSEKIIHTVLLQSVRVGNLTEIKRPFTFCFSWCEDNGNDVCEQGMPTNVIECATQTEDIRIPIQSNIYYNTDSSNNIESATQTESTQSSCIQEICNCKEKRNNKFLEILSKDFGSFYEGKTEPDCVFRVGETRFPAHRTVLSARSTVFAAMFHHDTSEKQSGEVVIRDVDVNAFRDVLYYIYTGKVRGLCPDTAAPLYVVSDKYALIDLSEECLTFLKSNITIGNVCDAALLAHTHADAELENQVVQFIEENLENIIENDNWKTFSDNHSKLASKLFCFACMVSKRKLMELTY